ncbi:MAG: diguanylate cyclase [Armatimonadetes bacterium]|nr:diguanylate cyclase [Armatimonadota bacterium]
MRAANLSLFLSDQDMDMLGMKILPYRMLDRRGSVRDKDVRFVDLRVRRMALVVGFVSFIIAASLQVVAPPFLSVGFLYIVPVGVLSYWIGWEAGLSLVGAAMAVSLVVDKSMLGLHRDWQVGAYLATILLPLAGFSFFLGRLSAKLREYHFSSTTDRLTGLPNRTYLETFGSRIFSDHKKTQAEVVGVMIDCDRFKEINDAFGHAAGDQVLKILADVLNSEVRKTDLVCRLGGDEFFLMLFDVPEKVVKGVIGRIEDRFRRGVHEVGYESSLSVGVALGVQALDSVTEVLASADCQMYDRKGEKKSSVVAHFWR